MSDINLNVTIKKNWRSQNFDFLSVKNLSPGQKVEQFSPAPSHEDITEFQNFLLQFKNRMSQSIPAGGFYIIFFLILKGIMTR